MKKNAQKELYWRDTLKRQARSGLSVRRFCAERDVSEASFYAWRKKLARRDLGQIALSSQPPETASANSANGQAFIPLAVADSGPSLEVVHPLGYRIRIMGEVDSISLKRILDALDARGEK